MKNIESKIKFVPIGKQQGIKGYLIKISGYIFGRINPDENVSANNMLVYSPSYLGRNN